MSSSAEIQKNVGIFLIIGLVVAVVLSIAFKQDAELQMDVSFEAQFEHSIKCTSLRNAFTEALEISSELDGLTLAELIDAQQRAALLMANADIFEEVKESWLMQQEFYMIMAQVLEVLGDEDISHLQDPNISRIILEVMDATIEAFGLNNYLDAVGATYDFLSDFCGRPDLTNFIEQSRELLNDTEFSN